MNEALRGRRITILGGAGFIGHHLALALAGRGADVSVIDSLQVNNLLTLSEYVPDPETRELYSRMLQQRLDLLRRHGVAVHVQDVREYHALGRLLDQQIQPQVIVHLAAVSHSGRSNKDPWSTFDHSLRTLENALDCGRNKIDHFVYLSSSMVYGNFQTEEVDEGHPLNPIGIYGALKVAGEKIVIAYQQVFGLPYTIVRPSALYGPRCVSRRVGQVFIENAMRGKPLQIAGDGQEKLDFTYIADLVEGVCLVIQRPEARNETFNLTYGSARSINDLAKTVVRHLPTAGIEYGDRDGLMPVRGTLSIQKAVRLLGFKPVYPIEKGIREYVDWYNGLMGREPSAAPVVRT